LKKLHKQGFIIVSGLKSLKKESWEKLSLPLAIEEELKNQLAQSRAFAPWYGMGVPFGWAFPHQGGFWSGQYNSMGQPIYLPYSSYENQESVLGMDVANDKEKEKTEDKESEGSESMENLEHPSSENTVTLAPPELHMKQENSETNSK